MKPKVVLVIPSLVKSGVLEIVKNLIYENNGEVDYYLLALKRVKASQESSIRKRLGEKLIVLPGEKLISFKKIFQFKKEVNKLSPDIIHFHSFSADIYSIFLKKKMFKLISTAHNMGKEDFIPMFGQILGRIMSSTQLFLFKRMDLIVGVSKTVSLHYKKMGVNHVVTVLNGTHINNVAFQTNFKLLNSLKHPIGIYCGNLEKRKNVEFLFDTFSELSKNENFSSTLVVLGNDRYNKNTLDIYKEKYKNSPILFLGRKNNVFPYLHASDYFISASKSEGLPMSAIEAMASNLPLLLSNIPQHKELVFDDKESIFFFNPNEKKSLMKTLKDFIENWDKNILPINEKIFNKFLTSRKMFNSYVNVYCKLM